MPSWVTLAVPMVVAAMTIAVNAAINIRIKFAPDAATATRDVVGLVLRLVQWLCNIGLLASLFTEFFVSEPLTRHDVVVVAWDTGLLSYNLATAFTMRTVRIIEKHVTIFELLGVRIRALEEAKADTKWLDKP